MHTFQTMLLWGIAVCFVLPEIPASASRITNAVTPIARPVPLSHVRLTGGPLKHAQDLDAAYLLKLEPDRRMAYYRKWAGLAPKAEGYGGWDGDGKNLTGHIAGHYLSAVSLMYAATGDPRFKERADYLVQEMKQVQDRHGNGYLGALENGEERFEEVAHGNIRRERQAGMVTVAVGTTVATLIPMTNGCSILMCIRDRD